VQAGAPVFGQRRPRGALPRADACAGEPPPIPASGQRDLDHGLPRDREPDPRGLEARETRGRPPTLESEHDDPSRARDPADRPRRARQRRRRHHTRPPETTGNPGKTSTVTRKIPCACRLVSATVGNTSTGGFIVGPRSSPTSHERAPRTRSLFDMYGKNEL